MGYKLIACDLDETLLNDEHLVGAKNVAAIKRAREEYGVKFVPATGRGFMQIQPELKELQLYDLEGEYVISFNGGALTENKNNRILNFILCFLILVLLVIIGFIGYYLWQATGGF